MGRHFSKVGGHDNTGPPQTKKSGGPGPPGSDAYAGCTFVTGNQFSDIEFLHDGKILAMQLYFDNCFPAHGQLRPYFYFQLETWHHTYVNSVHPFSYNDAAISGQLTVYGDFCDE